MRYFLFFIPWLVSGLQAQEEPVLRATPVQKSGDVYKVAFPSPYVRLLALQEHLVKKEIAIDWNVEYERTAFKSFDLKDVSHDKGPLSMVIGIRLADGVIAYLDRDSEKLKRCANDVRVCAEALGASRDDLPAVGVLLRAIEAEDWSSAYFELGMIQQEIVAKVDDGKDSLSTLAVASGAWLQGIVYACDIILEHQSVVDLSNVLRAPEIATFLAGKLEELPEEERKSPEISSAIQALNQVFPLIDVARDELIKRSDLELLRKTAAAGLSVVVNRQTN
ncbi:MAG: hypothetical protein KBF76_10500 [Verrucomicrobiales bacterium]|jgi:hypothetical protein|nr:hypothetical protein [Verrucomicrobiales bacterium]